MSDINLLRGGDIPPRINWVDPTAPCTTTCPCRCSPSGCSTSSADHNLVDTPEHPVTAPAASSSQQHLRRLQGLQELREHAQYTGAAVAPAAPASGSCPCCGLLCVMAARSSCAAAPAPAAALLETLVTTKTQTTAQHEAPHKRAFCFHCCHKPSNSKKISEFWGRARTCT